MLGAFASRNPVAAIGLIREFASRKTLSPIFEHEQPEPSRPREKNFRIRDRSTHLLGGFSNPNNAIAESCHAYRHRRDF